MIVVMNFLSRISGAYIFSIPLIVVYFALKYEGRQKDAVVKIFNVVSLLAFLWGYSIYQDGTTIFYSIITWLLIIIPTSIAMLNLINENSEHHNKLNLKTLDIVGIPRKISALVLVLLITACLLIISDTIINRTPVMESHHRLMEEISKSSDPKVVLMAQSLNPYSVLEILENIEQIKNGKISVSYSSPWKINVIVLTEKPNKKTTWIFDYIRYFGQWKLDGIYDKQVITGFSNSK